MLACFNALRERDLGGFLVPVIVRQVLTQVRKFAIFCHRWMGLAFCVLFAWWFVSGIFMMYWDFPGVG